MLYCKKVILSFMNGFVIKGRIVDAAGNPIEGLVVVVKNENKYNIYDYLGTLMDSIDNLSLDTIKFGYLGKASTDRDGYYRISYNLSEYRHIHNKKSIKLIVKDSYGVFEHKVEYGHIEIKKITKSMLMTSYWTDLRLMDL